MNLTNFDISAVPYFYGSTPIHAWGGPGKGTVEMRASDFATYLPTPDHPGLFELLIVRFGNTLFLVWLSMNTLHLV
jgi:hypothetical protein